jgi:hypothetical protein
MNAEQALSKEVAAARALHAAMALVVGDDVETLRDTIEGETNLHDAIQDVIGSVREDEILVAGLTTIIADLEQRKGRLSERIARKRAAIEQAMQIGELKKLELPDCTLSLKSVPPKVEITDEALIPGRFFKKQDPTLDKKALADALKQQVTDIASAIKEGREPPAPIAGAQLGNGGIALQIRRS